MVLLWDGGAIDSGLLCENPKRQTSMRLKLQKKMWIVGICLAEVLAVAQPPAANAPKASVPVVLVGATVIDVTDWGHSAKDLTDSVVVIRDGRIQEVGPRLGIPIPKGARLIDCTGKYLIPGLIDGLAGMNSQGQANAFLYMGVTTVVAVSDSHRGMVDLNANPSPNLYLVDSIGTTDNYSLLARRHPANGRGPDWAGVLREGPKPVQLSTEETAKQLTAISHSGTRVLVLGRNLTAASAQWIISHAHQGGLVTYGEFVSTPYRVGIEAGVDALPFMGHYELGVIPDELQKPLVEDSAGSAATTAYDYSRKLPPLDLHVRYYARMLATHHAALMPAFSRYYLQLPNHRNLWKEQAAALLDPAHLDSPPDRESGEFSYDVSYWFHHLPGSTQRWLEDSQRKKADLEAMRLWKINQTFFAAQPHALAASGASAHGTMPGISMHTELELLVRMGLSPREALAAATNNYSLQFGWNDIGLISAGRRADILVLDSDPTANVWNARRISTLVLDGNLVDRESLLKSGR